MVPGKIIPEPENLQGGMAVKNWFELPETRDAEILARRSCWVYRRTTEPVAGVTGGYAVWVKDQLTSPSDDRIAKGSSLTEADPGCA